MAKAAQICGESQDRGPGRSRDGAAATAILTKHPHRCRPYRTSPRLLEIADRIANLPPNTPSKLVRLANLAFWAEWLALNPVEVSSGD
jgi:hypothetical protein